MQIWRLSMASHALLSASSAGRWLQCPPSAKLESEYPDNTSKYAEEGTLAHKLAELELRYATKKCTKAVYLKELEGIKADDLYTDEMPSYVETYVSYVMERYTLAKKQCKDTVFILEGKVDYSKYVPGGFGTGDTIIVSDAVLEVIDLKYGKGVKVEAEDNVQMQLYTLGAYHEYGLLYDCSKVCMSIVQPRLDGISTQITDIPTLTAWGDKIKPTAQLAFEGLGDFKAGDHCKFCKHKIHCKAQIELVESVADLALTPVDCFKLSSDQIADLLSKKDIITKYLKTVEEYALDEALAGRLKIDGFKVVEGKSIRKYTNEPEVAAAAIQAGLTIDQIYENSLISITKMEKLLKTNFNEVLGDFIVKPQGSPTLVPVTDKRPEWSGTLTTDEAFSDLLN